MVAEPMSGALKLSYIVRSTICVQGSVLSSISLAVNLFCRIEFPVFEVVFNNRITLLFQPISNLLAMFNHRANVIQTPLLYAVPYLRSERTTT